jgi:uncharacterized protein (TIGR02118 family)
MIHLMVLYPKGEGTTFDADYWASTHMPLVGESWSTVTKWEATKGDDNAPFYAAAHIYFASMEDLGAAMGSEATAKVMADVSNYTNIEPQVSIYEVITTS